ncbi:hypothetical protein KCP70_10840 [Salmonella enterica subsp. enterica]|nr:hypothetical protein KCP70_10840 [Salmonella enterica subsp. enterica]
MIIAFITVTASSGALACPGQGNIHGVKKLHHKGDVHTSSNVAAYSLNGTIAYIYQRRRYVCRCRNFLKKNMNELVSIAKNMVTSNSHLCLPCCRYSTDTTGKDFINSLETMLINRINS